MDRAGEYAHVVIAYGGRSSTVGRLRLPRLGNKLRQGRAGHIVAVDFSTRPTRTRGPYAPGFGDTGRLAALKAHPAAAIQPMPQKLPQVAVAA